MKSLIFTCLLAFCASFTIQAQASLSGDWKMSVTNPEGETFTAKLTIKDNGKYLVDLGIDGTADVRGSYTLDGNQITISDSEGTNACPPDKKGVYKYRVSATALEMEKISDECEGRGGPEGKMSFTRM